MKNVFVYSNPNKFIPFLMIHSRKTCKICKACRIWKIFNQFKIKNSKICTNKIFYKIFLNNFQCSSNILIHKCKISYNYNSKWAVKISINNSKIDFMIKIMQGTRYKVRCSSQFNIICLQLIIISNSLTLINHCHSKIWRLLIRNNNFSTIINLP